MEFMCASKAQNEQHQSRVQVRFLASESSDSFSLFKESFHFSKS